MFRLMKLAIYGLLGWAIYELYQGMIQGTTGGSSSGGGSSRTLRRALNEDTGRMNMTSGGEGTTAETSDFDGGSMRHSVGRGVISR